jgi:predicted PurR-regulated permease PerM
MTAISFRRAFLILLVVFVTLAFLWMIQIFLMTILLAALFTGVSYPVYRRISRWFGGRDRLAAVVTLLLLFLLVVLPILGVLGAVAREAVRVNESVLPALQKALSEPNAFDEWLRHLPFYDKIEPYRGTIVTKLGEFAAGLGVVVVDLLRATTMATVVFIFHFVVMLYTMFFFFLDGPRLVQSLMSHLPVTEVDKQHLLDQFVSVTRATLKGTVVIGIIQGVMGGLSFWMVGIQGAMFWGTIMTVLSIIPGVGGALVWVPAAIILVAIGKVWPAVFLVLFSALVIGSVDNLLRPILVGRDTKMHELMIFFSTLGGLLVFGAMGFILGPILAALFMTVWDIFRSMFGRELAESASDVIVTPQSVVVSQEGILLEIDRPQD